MFAFHFSFSQNPLVTQWDYRYGGTEHDFLSGILQTSDGGLMLGGYSLSPVSGDKTQPLWGPYQLDYWIVKLDSFGIKQWDRDFQASNDDYLTAMQQTKDGGYIVGGYSLSGYSFGDKTQNSFGYNDYWIVKIDALGNKQWDKAFGGTLGDYLTSIDQTSDGGYILGGYSWSDSSGNKSQAHWGEYDYWIVKTDSLGNKQWDKDFGGTKSDWLYSVKQTKDGGYILGGHSNSQANGNKTHHLKGSEDYWIVKTDANGVKQWDKDYGGNAGNYLNSLQETTDGGFILGGSSSSGISGDKTQASKGGGDYWIVKTDSAGNILWDKDFGGTGGDGPIGSICQTSDKGYLIAGLSGSPISGDKTEDNLSPGQTWVVKTDSLGNKQWDKTLRTNYIPYYGLDEQTGFAIQTKDGCYAMANCTTAGIGGDKTQPSWENYDHGTYDYWIIKFCDTTFSCPLPTASIAADGPTTICKPDSVLLTLTSSYSTNFQWKKGGNEIAGATNATYSATKTGTYKCLVTNGCGSKTSNKISVTANPQPAATITAPNGLDLCPTGSVLLQANSGAGYSYQWKKGANNISGATNQSYTATTKGTYKVVVTNTFNCSKTSSGAKVIKTCREEQLLADNIELSVYPNPASDRIQVESNFLMQKIELHDLAGRLLFSNENVNSNSASLNLEKLPKAMYVITCFTTSGAVRKSFVKD